MNATNTTTTSAGASIPQYGTAAFKSYTIPGRPSSASTGAPLPPGVPTPPKKTSAFKEFDFTKYNRLNATIVHSNEGSSLSKLRFSFTNNKTM
jgi:hypothetical protein